MTDAVQPDTAAAAVPDAVEPGIRVEISSDHGVDTGTLPAVPRTGEYIVLDRPESDTGHGPERVERVRYVLWTANGVATVDTDCVSAP